MSARAKAVLRGVNAVACGLVVAAAFLLAQHDAATLPQQAIAVVCFSAAQLVGVHRRPRRRPRRRHRPAALRRRRLQRVREAPLGSGAAGVWGLGTWECEWLELGQERVLLGTGAVFK